MIRSAIVDNYARTLLELASREGEAEAYGRLLADLVALGRTEPDVARFLETPRIDLADKKRILREALSGEAPESFVRFVLVVMDKGRQRLLPDMEAAYRDLLDEREGRVHAQVTLAREPDETLREAIVEGLRDVLGGEVVAHFQTDEKIVGGLLVRVGDRVLDGSLRRRLEDLRRELAREPAGPRA
ncbi:MAG TPA: ATP synthase F1 subunit delta [Gemmatimonadota bacterium]|nr:ATP synthase F1 subunit delta [Gemmatimonadota bacterium]